MTRQEGIQLAIKNIVQAYTESKVGFDGMAEDINEVVFGRPLTYDPEDRVNPKEHEYQDFIKFFSMIQTEVHQTAIDKGWWKERREDGTLIALMHEELSESLRALRKHRPMDDKIEHFESLVVELADTVIRIMDFCERHKLKLASAIVDKSIFNRARSYKHGGKDF